MTTTTEHHDHAPSPPALAFGHAPAPLSDAWHLYEQHGTAQVYAHIRSGLRVATWWTLLADACRWSILIPRTVCVAHARAIARDFGFGPEAGHHVDHDVDHRIFVTAMRWGSTWTRGGAS